MKERNTMSRYSIGKPEPARPITTAGTWDNEPCVLSLQTRVKLVVRVPEKHQAFGPGFDVAAEDFEAMLRRIVARELVGTAYAGFEVVGAVVEQFEDAGG
jgi:hypothetical protein